MQLEHELFITVSYLKIYTSMWAKQAADIIEEKKKHAITKLYIVYNSISIRTHGSYAQSQFQQDLTGDILVVAHFLKVT